jgi:hypothetical protein
MVELYNLAPNPKSLIYAGLITRVGPGNVISIASLANFGDTFFRGWYIYTIKKADGTITAPYHNYVPITQYVSGTGQFYYAVYGGTPAIGDEVYVLFPIAGPMVGPTGICFEQVAVPVNVAASNAGEVTILDLSDADTRYILRDLRIKSVNPNPNTVTIHLYQLINGVQVQTDFYPINNINSAQYHNLMDMFGIPQIAGDDILITVDANAIGPYGVTGQYSYAKNNV